MHKAAPLHQGMTVESLRYEQVAVVLGKPDSEADHEALPLARLKNRPRPLRCIVKRDNQASSRSAVCCTCLFALGAIGARQDPTNYQ